jgi:hypothetical protein
MEPVNTRYDADTPEEMKESLKKAEVEFADLCKVGFRHVRIVISDHPYNEGIWVEASDEPMKPVSDLDSVYKSNEPEAARSIIKTHDTKSN